MVRLNVSVIVEKGGRRESGSAGGGGRFGLAGLMTRDNWQATAREALRVALVNFDAVPAPAGVMDVALGPGWPGILLHEAIGHGLEGDFNRKKSSAFAGLMGERIASKGVTIIDDGTIPDRRGSISFDDEGTPSARNVLIEDGVLIDFMWDELRAKAAGRASSGNGRRQSYKHLPMVRMTNTYLANGETDPDDIIADKKVRNQFADLQDTGYGNLPVCMAKTQYSFSTDPNLKGAPTGHVVPIREVRLSAGAGFIVVVCGEIMTMPGLPRVPAANAIHLNKKGMVEGLF